MDNILVYTRLLGADVIYYQQTKSSVELVLKQGDEYDKYEVDAKDFYRVEDKLKHECINRRLLPEPTNMKRGENMNEEFTSVLMLLYTSMQGYGIDLLKDSEQNYLTAESTSMDWSTNVQKLFGDEHDGLFKYLYESYVPNASSPMHECDVVNGYLVYYIQLIDDDVESISYNLEGYKYNTDGIDLDDTSLSMTDAEGYPV